MDEKRRQYLKEYHEKHYKRIPLDVTPEFYEEIKSHAAAAGEKVNAYIQTAIKLRFDSEKK